MIVKFYPDRDAKEDLLDIEKKLEMNYRKAKNPLDRTNAFPNDVDTLGFRCLIRGLSYRVKSWKPIDYDEMCLEVDIFD